MSTTEDFWTLIRQARWFAGKSRGGQVSAHHVLDWYADRPRVRSEILTVSYPDGSKERYHVPVVYLESPTEHLITRTGEGYAHEATYFPEAMSAILEAIRSARSNNDLICHSLGAESLNADLPPKRYEGEQSNTSVFLGDRAMLKFFRKLEPGHNLDIELHAALSGSTAVAKLYGWIEGGGWDLAMLVEALPDPQDGYQLACSRVGQDFEQEISALGVTLAKVHRQLAQVLGTGTITGSSLAHRFISHAKQIAQEAEPLQEVLDPLIKRFQSLDGDTFLSQRVHGDFHLGQALLTPNGWRIVDFEGEPMKSMAERSAMDSPWRDVAGLLRSIDYAAATSTSVPSSNWRTATRAAFLKAYCGAVGISTSAALEAYELDKAVYEVRYEIRNRPHLVQVPLNFLVPTLKEI